MRRIFYFNITYGCNSNCIFCYSHNTRHNSMSFNEINFEKFFRYLDEYKLSLDDRVIINGGEPLLHTEIMNILLKLIEYGCEVLVYTNGRLLTQFDFSNLSNRYRFVVPIHGHEELHDKITGVIGSYKETIEGLYHMSCYKHCLVDIKIIINKYMVCEDYEGTKLFESLDGVVFNNAVHITKMADTIISKRNGCESVTNDEAAHFTKLLFDYYKSKGREIKLFDTCIDLIEVEEMNVADKIKDSIIVYFKDNNQFRVVDLSRRTQECMRGCKKQLLCNSAVDEYRVLEYCAGKMYIDLE